VVENTWESGYGMPSFTLLGPRVMRFPFILHTSLPHEILHNWWGNGVYVDYSQGNWSEGLTAYLADHLLREQQGEGVSYRRNALLRYTNYVSAGNDFPLKDFQGRHDEATQAVGYDKALMVFHMLRLQMGDNDFLTALRNFYNEQRFHLASWDDLRHAFEAVSGQSLRSEFDQWLNRRGAPALQLHAARAQPKGDHYQLSVDISQDQAGPAYHLHVPVAVQLAGRQQTWQAVIELTHKQQTVQLAVPSRPWRLAVDPQFDVFRRLDPGELPASLSEALGADSLLVVLPSAAPSSLREAYAQFAQAWAADGVGIEIRWDKDLSQLPTDRAVWLLGWKNRFLPQLAADLQPQLALSATGVTVDKQSLTRTEQAVVLTARHGGASGTVLMWLGCDNPAAFTGLTRKLPHYGSYSYLAFKGNEPTNTLKGQWEVINSPLEVTIKQKDDALPPNTPLNLRARSALITN
jgi:aminopeptidase N